MTACRTWQDHEWGGPVFVEAGRHPTMGRFQRWVVTCARCGHTTTRTDWVDLPGTARPPATEEM